MLIYWTFILYYIYFTGIFNGPDIHRLMRDKRFENAFIDMELVAWDCVKTVIDNVGIHRFENWRILIEDMLTAFHRLNVRMSKIHFFAFPCRKIRRTITKRIRWAWRAFSSSDGEARTLVQRQKATCSFSWYMLEFTRRRWRYRRIRAIREWKMKKIKKNVFFENDEKSIESIQFFSNSFYSICIRRYDVYSIDFHRLKFNKW